jgi:outer membrane receptor protein involved in Fe transport
MKRLLVILFLFIGAIAYGQKATVEGNVIDSKTGQPLTGVSVVVTETKQGISTDIRGHYVLVVNGKQKISLEFSYGGVTQPINEIELIANGIVTQNVSFIQKDKTEEAVVVRATTTSKKETTNAGIAFQKNANTVASIITAETIKRSPDRNTAEVIKRTPGASVQEGKFLVIRGLADRYNQAMLNGILLTSTEPDRKTFSFDLIPSAMIDNVTINKAFVPEYPGEWAGGLVQVNTKDIPSKNFLNIQIGTGINTQVVGKPYFEDKGGKLDWLGVDDGTRALPKAYTTKVKFDTMSRASQTAIGKSMRNAWMPSEINAPVNSALQINGGFTGKLFGKKIGGIFGINYSKNNRNLELVNRFNVLEEAADTFKVDFNFDDRKYQQDIQVGALGSISIQFNRLNKVSIKSIINVNSSNATVIRNGVDFTRQEELQGNEFTFKQNTFYTTQLMGEHGLHKNVKLKWYGAFNILDGNIPDQRRILYRKALGVNEPYSLLISGTLAQNTGSRIFQNLSDYIYTAGGDVNFVLKNKHNIKAGYMLQIRDRLYDAKLFANYLNNTSNTALLALPADKVFAENNFADDDKSFRFGAIKGNTFRYMANTILNAGFIQFDDEFFNKLRVVYGLRVEHFDQLVGSVKTWDKRHTYSVVTDFLPGLNATYKLNSKTNIRLSGSQTVIRPELRELAALNLYDFELNASIQGNPNLKRTKVTNADLRYEFYNKPGEVLTVGLFYKNFKDPIEQLFNAGVGGSSTFNFQNPKSAYSTGIEVEVRKKLVFTPAFKNFTVQANAAIIKSKVTDVSLQLNRPLQGQSPYLINTSLLYDLEKQGLNLTLLYNRIGPRIFLVGDAVAGSGFPDIYEAPRSVIDFIAAKKVMKQKGEVRLSFSDILNQTQIFYQNTVNGKKRLEKGEDAFRFTRRFGTSINIAFNYSL